MKLQLMEEEIPFGNHNFRVPCEFWGDTYKYMDDMALHVTAVYDSTFALFPWCWIPGLSGVFHRSKGSFIENLIGGLLLVVQNQSKS